MTRTIIQQCIILFGTLLHIHETKSCKEGAPDSHEELSGAEKGKRAFDDEASGELVALRSDGGIVQTWLAQTGRGVRWNNNGGLFMWMTVTLVVSFPAWNIYLRFVVHSDLSLLSCRKCHRGPIYLTNWQLSANSTCYSVFWKFFFWEIWTTHSL